MLQCGEHACISSSSVRSTHLVISWLVVPLVEVSTPELDLLVVSYKLLKKLDRSLVTADGVIVTMHEESEQALGPANVVLGYQPWPANQGTDDRAKIDVTTAKLVRLSVGYDYWVATELGSFYGCVSRHRGESSRKREASQTAMLGGGYKLERQQELGAARASG